MRAIMLAITAAFIMSVPMAAAVKAEDTTIIKKKDVDGDRSKTIIKKDEPRDHDVDKKVIIRKDND
jgi:Ni/Co efflux regulator RcnB